MSLLARIAPPAPAAPAPALAPGPGAELGDDELEQVVGGLERVYVPGLPIAPR